MAENKKSFLFYCDWIHTIEKLTDEQAGKLFKHMLRYVNDLDPKIDELMLDIVFEPIKQALKRDLKKWESIKERNKINGSKGGRPRNPKNPVGNLATQKNPDKPKKPDSVIVSVNDSVSEYLKNTKLNSLFLEYLQIRKKQKLSNSKIVTDRLIKKLREFSDNKTDAAEEIIMKAITAKWKDFYPLSK